MEVHAFNPSTWKGGRGRRIPELEANLVYRVNSRTARATQRNPVTRKKKNQKAKTIPLQPMIRTASNLKVSEYEWLAQALTVGGIRVSLSYKVD